MRTIDRKLLSERGTTDSIDVRHGKLLDLDNVCCFNTADPVISRRVRAERALLAEGRTAALAANPVLRIFAGQCHLLRSDRRASSK